jgi:hypothetical protein
MYTRLNSILGSFAKLRKATTSFDMSVCLSVRPRLSTWNNSAPTGRIVTKFDIRVFKKKSREDLSFNTIGQE